MMAMGLFYITCGLLRRTNQGSRQGTVKQKKKWPPSLAMDCIAPSAREMLHQYSAFQCTIWLFNIAMENHHF
jgi:hypothetical protein